MPPPWLEPNGKVMFNKFKARVNLDLNSSVTRYWVEFLKKEMQENRQVFRRKKFFTKYWSFGGIRSPEQPQRRRLYVIGKKLLVLSFSVLLNFYNRIFNT